MRQATMKDVQHPWDCRWIRLARDVVGFPELERAGGRWVGGCAAASRTAYSELRSTSRDRERMRRMRVLGAGRPPEA